MWGILIFTAHYMDNTVRKQFKIELYEEKSAATQNLQLDADNMFKTRQMVSMDGSWLYSDRKNAMNSPLVSIIVNTIK